MQPTDQTSTGGVVVSGVDSRAKEAAGQGGGASLTRSGVVLEAEHNLGSAVPPRRDVFCQVAGVLVRVDGEAAGESKVADLKLAVGVDEEVTGLQVAVKHVGGVDVFEAAEDLVDEGLVVGVCEGLAGPDDGGEIALHQLLRAG